MLTLKAFIGQGLGRQSDSSVPKDKTAKWPLMLNNLLYFLKFLPLSNQIQTKLNITWPNHTALLKFWNLPLLWWVSGINTPLFYFMRNFTSELSVIGTNSRNKVLKSSIEWKHHLTTAVYPLWQERSYRNHTFPIRPRIV